MAHLAIKGHATRGKEVINLLEMLGANRLGYKDTFVGFYYYIKCGAICSSGEYPTYSTIFTLEEFLEKYPYKVGDEVEYKSIGDANLKSKIIYMEWCNSLNKVLYTTEDAQVISTEDITETKAIPPYMDYDIKEDKGTLVQIDFTRELRIADEVEVILGDYEFVLKDGKTYFVKKKPQYPKTYAECCKIMQVARPIVWFDYDDVSSISKEGDEYVSRIENILYAFRKLLICRDAYWKIAGGEMRLDKPWEPDWNHINRKYYCIYNSKNNIVKNVIYSENKILAFPTAEMRDEFYANFKNLIEQCKELL